MKTAKVTFYEPTSEAPKDGGGVKVGIHWYKAFAESENSAPTEELVVRDIELHASQIGTKVYSYAFVA